MKNIDLIVQEANYIIDNHATLRECAKHFKRSKSSVHLDMRDRLLVIDYDLYLRVAIIINNNWSVKHVRGGNANKLRWKKQRESEI